MSGEEWQVWQSWSAVATSLLPTYHQSFRLQMDSKTENIQYNINPIPSSDSKLSALS